MNTNDLYLEYARVIQMCKGTELEDTPWVCVKNNGQAANNHPCFSFDYDTYSFAVAVLEGKPVWVGDVIYDKQDQYARKIVVTGLNEHGLLINGIAQEWRSWRDNASFTPPTPKRTFTLNGVVLPCPVRVDEFASGAIILGGEPFYFNSIEEAHSVECQLITLLTEARDKP